MLIREIRARHIIGKSGLGDGLSSVNPFVGCSHACAYCYAVFMKRFTDHLEPWGSFVDVKTNGVDLFPADYRRMREGDSLFFGSVTDVYQPLEKKYGVMRGILEFLADLDRPAPPDLFSGLSDEGEPGQMPPKKQTSLFILTKSDLVLRDLDLIRRIPSISVGFSIAMPDERARKIFEPGASPLVARLNALEKFHNAGVRTFVFINPVLPHITPVEKILHRIAPFADSVFGESLNIRYGNLPEILDAVRRYNPNGVESLRRSLHDSDYWSDVKKRFDAVAREEKIASEGFHIHEAPLT